MVLGKHIAALLKYTLKCDIEPTLEELEPTLTYRYPMPGHAYHNRHRTECSCKVLLPLGM